MSDPALPLMQPLKLYAFDSSITADALRIFLGFMDEFCHLLSVFVQYKICFVQDCLIPSLSGYILIMSAESTVTD